MSTLQDILDHRRLTVSQVIDWASAIAAELSRLHEQGLAHGAVAAEAVRIEHDGASLTPAAGGQACPDLPRDIVEFAGLLRTMIENVRVETDGERAQWSVLDRIATTNSRASSDGRMTKVAAALRLLRSSRTAVPRAEPSGRGARILMLIREVPPATPVNPGRFTAKTIHVAAFLASAAIVAIIVGLAFLKIALH